MSATEFYSAATITYLRQLAKNNNREWFAEKKPDYERYVLEPSLRLIEAVGASLEKQAPMLRAEPKRQGGSLMRIYRDTRFSKNKDPLKTNIGIHFRHESGRDVHAPGIYLHIQPDECFLGAGIWHPENPVLMQIRQAIVDDTQQWKHVTSKRSFGKSFELTGDSLKRPPKGFAPDHPLIDDLRRKDFIGIVSLSESDVTDPHLPKVILKHVKTAGPFMQFLCGSMGLVY
jgi:uncharacterized protein (TIGR02453 family)